MGRKEVELVKTVRSAWRTHLSERVQSIGNAQPSSTNDHEADGSNQDSEWMPSFETVRSSLTTFIKSTLSKDISEDTVEYVLSVLSDHLNTIRRNFSTIFQKVKLLNKGKTVDYATGGDHSAQMKMLEAIHQQELEHEKLVRKIQHQTRNESFDWNTTGKWTM
mmetsp:Transcript_62451/g.167517  ORF Transcript_62451/g.167517 Transcript_62451/m.167517 type:complete len:163 (+) Transcript_62451:2-490(+)